LIILGYAVGRLARQVRLASAYCDWTSRLAHSSSVAHLCAGVLSTELVAVEIEIFEREKYVKWNLTLPSNVITARVDIYWP